MFSGLCNVQLIERVLRLLRSVLVELASVLTLAEGRLPRELVHLHRNRRVVGGEGGGAAVRRFLCQGGVVVAVVIPSPAWH